MKNGLLFQVAIVVLCSLAGMTRAGAQCAGPMSVPILGAGTGISLSADETHVDALCPATNGSATITAMGGTPPYIGTGTFPQLPGTQQYTVTDAAGCTATVAVTIGVTDNTPPTIDCPASNTVTPPPGECIYTVVGTDYDATASDDCNVSLVNDANNLPSLNGATFGVGSHVIMWTATDAVNLVNTCQFTLTVSACIEISGTIIWQGDGFTGVNNVNVALSGDATDNDVTVPAGTYSLIANTGSNFVITPTKNPPGGMFNGVTAADATVIQQHLTGTALITDFFRLLAADANKSNTISSVDAALIRQGLLGNPSATAILNATGAWRFVRTDYIYPDPAGPYTLPNFSLFDTRTLTGASGSVPGQDFWGVKTGDVYEEVSPGIADPSLKPDPDAKPLVWRVRDRTLKAGEAVDLDFTVVNFEDIAAFQHGMRFDPAVLQYQGVTILGTGIPMDAAGNFGAYQVAQGELRTLWSVAQGVTLPGIQPMYRARFKALQGGVKLSEVVSFDPNILSSVAYTTVLAPRTVQLIFTDYKNPGLPALGGQENLPDLGVELLQNRPNPFSDHTTIGFILPEACDAQLRVFDISGRELWRTDKSYPAGYSEELIRAGELDATGLLFYELTTPQGQQTRKMMRVRM